jgi:PilZ domain
MSKETIQLPRLTEVNISGGGVSFSLPRRLQAGDQLDLHIILPPFSAIQARVDVMHATPVDGKGARGGRAPATRRSAKMIMNA